VKLYGQIILMSTLATLLPYAFCSLAVFLPGGRRATVGAAATIIALLAFAYAIFAIYGAGHETVFWASCSPLAAACLRVGDAPAQSSAAS